MLKPPMTPDRWRQIEDLYHAAREREPGDRAALLANADPELRREVEEMLAQPSGGSPLDRPAWEGAAGATLTQTQLAVGAQLGPYKIEALLGTGGMGEVWKAHDTRLNRTVAIKTSQHQFSDRFAREARAVAALNHPHICQIYDIGPNYLVLEYVEGAPLKGPLALEKTIEYATQMLDALDHAHRKTVIHRDLKPANILVTKQGIKVLDFGLASMATEATLTQVGAVMGTPAYMAPEQREGKAADARTDIYAIGCVLHEMVTGKRASQERTQVESPAMERVIQRCLEPDPDARWQTAREVKVGLEWIATSSATGYPSQVSASAAASVSRRAMLPWIAGAVAGAGGAGLAAWAWRGPSSPAPTGAIRFGLAPPKGARLERNFTRQSLALSPVGRRLAMIATDERGSMVWVQRLDSLTANALQGTEGATMVFWSPDGQFIGFWAGGKLQKIPAEGGTPLTICDLSGAWAAAWNQDGIIVVQTAVPTSFSISVKSGAISPRKLVQWPKFLPGGKHLLSVSFDPKIGHLRAYVEELSTGRETALMPTDTQVFFIPDQPQSTEGYLLFGSGGTLLALRFDADRLSVAGEPRPVAKDVPFFATGWSEFDASADGVLIHSSGSQEAQLTWLDRGGRELNAVGDPKEFFGLFRLSPDGKKVVADVFAFSRGGADIWTNDLSQPTAERVTFEHWGANAPVWSPDGTRIAFGTGEGGPMRLRVKAVSDRGGGEGFPGDGFQFPSDWSADGRWIFYTTSGGDVNGEIWVASMPDRKVMPLVQTQFDSAFPTLSPNGEYLAFSANDGGHYEIYVQRFQGGDAPKLTGERHRVSYNGGNGPRWRRDGKELFSLSPDRHIMALAVKPGTGIEFGTPTALFRLPTSFRSLAPVTVGFDVSPDGQRFLVPIRKEAGAPLQVVVNWQAEFKK